MGWTKLWARRWRGLVVLGAQHPRKTGKEGENPPTWGFMSKVFESKGSLMLEVMVRSDYVHNKGEGKVWFSVNLSETCVNEAALCRTFLVCTSWYQTTEDTTDVTDHSVILFQTLAQTCRSGILI